MSLRDLLRNGTIDAWQGAIIWAALARRRSMTVIAGPSGVGKTTLLTALMCLLPSQTRLLYLRGCFETFSFLQDEAVDPQRTALLVNEVSPHLPIYLWGPAVTRALDATCNGFALLGTAHGHSVPEFVATLTGSPLHIPPAKVAALDLVVLLERTERSHSGRHVVGVWKLRATQRGLAIESLVGCSSDISNESSNTTASPTHTTPFPLLELHQRHRALLALRDGTMNQSFDLADETHAPWAIASGTPSPNALSDPPERE